MHLDRAIQILEHRILGAIQNDRAGAEDDNFAGTTKNGTVEQKTVTTGSTTVTRSPVPGSTSLQTEKQAVTSVQNESFPNYLDSQDSSNEAIAKLDAAITYLEQKVDEYTATNAIRLENVEDRTTSNEDEIVKSRSLITALTAAAAASVPASLKRENRTVSTSSSSTVSLSNAYTVGDDSLLVYGDGVLLTKGTDYTETSTPSITLTGQFLPSNLSQTITLDFVVLAAQFMPIQRESITITSSSSSTVTLANSYTLGDDSLMVYGDGALLAKGTDYTEASTTSVTLIGQFLPPNLAQATIFDFVVLT